MCSTTLTGNPLLGHTLTSTTLGGGYSSEGLALKAELAALADAVGQKADRASVNQLSAQVELLRSSPPPCVRVGVADWPTTWVPNNGLVQGYESTSWKRGKRERKAEFLDDLIIAINRKAEALDVQHMSHKVSALEARLEPLDATQLAYRLNALEVQVAQHASAIVTAERSIQELSSLYSTVKSSKDLQLDTVRSRLDVLERRSPSPVPVSVPQAVPVAVYDPELPYPADTVSSGHYRRMQALSGGPKYRAGGYYSPSRSTLHLYPNRREE